MSADLAQNSDELDYSQRVAPAFLIGTYLAVNAIRDLYLLVEGPDCAHMKTQYVQGNHDWLSTLTSVSGLHRVGNTAIHPDQMGGSREPALRERLLTMASHARVPALALTPMPMAMVTGADYARLVRDVAATTGKPVIYFARKELSGDWLDGYAEALAALAAQVDVSGGNKRPENVALVGYLFDRNEGDHTANLKEVEGLLECLGLKVISTWLSGRSYANLEQIRDADTVISLPYGRRAAAILSRRINARLIETALPIGLQATEDWLRTIGKVLGRDDKAQGVIDSRLRSVVPRLEWVIPSLLLGRQVGYVGDPYLLPGLAEFLDSIGISVPFFVITNATGRAREIPPNVRDCHQLIDPRQHTLSRFLRTHAGRNQIDLLIANNAGYMEEVPTLEFGFPSLFRHALYERPFLGFSGALALADSIANKIQEGMVRKAHLARYPRNMPRPPDAGGSVS